MNFNKGTKIVLPEGRVEFLRESTTCGYKRLPDVSVGKDGLLFLNQHDEDLLVLTEDRKEGSWSVEDGALIRYREWGLFSGLQYSTSYGTAPAIKAVVAGVVPLGLRKGGVPYPLAVMRGSQNETDLLKFADVWMKAGGWFGERDWEGSSPAGMAASCGWSKLLVRIMDSGGAALSRGKYGSPLGSALSLISHEICSSNGKRLKKGVEIVKVLLKKPVDGILEKDGEDIEEWLKEIAQKGVWSNSSLKSGQAEDCVAEIACLLHSNGFEVRMHGSDNEFGMGLLSKVESALLSTGKGKRMSSIKSGI